MATIAERLAHAESEYHNLITGNKPMVVVDQNGERVEYTPANAGRLAMYIADLKRQLNPSSSTSRPLSPWF